MHWKKFLYQIQVRGAPLDARVLATNPNLKKMKNKFPFFSAKTSWGWRWGDFLPVFPVYSWIAWGFPRAPQESLQLWAESGRMVLPVCGATGPPRVSLLPEISHLFSGTKGFKTLKPTLALHAQVQACQNSDPNLMFSCLCAGFPHGCRGPKTCTILCSSLRP